jgi:hypothetical protein
MVNSIEFRKRILILLDHHQKQQGFFRWSCRLASELESYSTKLKKTVIRLVDARVDYIADGQQVNSKKEGETQSDQTSDGSLAKDLTALVCLIKSLHDLSDNISAYFSQDEIEEGSQPVFQLPFAEPLDNELFRMLFVILNCEELIRLKLLRSSQLLGKAINLFENIDLSLKTVLSDFASVRSIPGLLLVGSEIVNEATTAIRKGADLIRLNECLWNCVSEKVKQLNVMKEMGK